MDFNRLTKDHPDYNIIQHAIKLMKTSQLNYPQLQFEILVELVDGVHNRGMLFHHDIFNLIVFTLIKHVRPLYEASLLKEKEEEKAIAEHKQAQNEDVKPEGQPELALMQKAEEKSEGLKLVEPASDDEIGFILNGKEWFTGESFLSYENIIKLAGAQDEKDVYTVTYSYKDSKKSGIAVAGQLVEISDDLVINAVVTNNN
jgi:hypothetical protein